jgi:hypothetical protein
LDNRTFPLIGLVEIPRRGARAPIIDIFPSSHGTGSRRRRYGRVATGKGDHAMASRDDLGARNVPAIDWLELFIWTLLITMSSALALMLMR